MTDPGSPVPSSLPPSDDDHRARLAGLLVRAVGMVSTSASARLAEAVFCRTARPKPRSDELEFLNAASRDDLSVQGVRIARYRWGPRNAPLVLVAHGWWSHAGRFTSIASELQQRGLQICAFDAPGHGRSGGWRATMPEFARAIRVVAEATGPLHGLVGHSLGGAASIFAVLHGLRVERTAILAAPANTARWVERFRVAVRMDPSAYALMRRNLARRLGVGWHDLDLHQSVKSLTTPALVIHDADDRDVPCDEGQLLAKNWPAADFYQTSGLGHHRLLRDRAVVKRVADFIAA